jgi:hypothetical protein
MVSTQDSLSPYPEHNKNTLQNAIAAICYFLSILDVT